MRVCISIGLLQTLRVQRRLVDFRKEFGCQLECPGEGLSPAEDLRRRGAGREVLRLLSDQLDSAPEFWLSSNKGDRSIVREGMACFDMK